MSGFYKKSDVWLLVSLSVTTSVFLAPDLSPLSASAQAPDFAELSCQREIIRRLTGPGSGDSFVRFNDDVRRTSLSEVETRIQGRGQQVSFYSDGAIIPTAFTYNCTVNPRDRKIANATYRMDGGGSAPTSTKPNTIELCQSVVKQELVAGRKVDFGEVMSDFLLGGPSVAFSQPAQTYFISDAEEGVRGSAIIKKGFNQRQVKYDCKVNLQQKRVTNTTYQ